MTSKKPTAKVTAAAIGGAIATLLICALAIFAPEAYARVPPGAEGAIATLVALALGYWVRESK